MIQVWQVHSECGPFNLVVLALNNRGQNMTVNFSRPEFRQLTERSTKLLEFQVREHSYMTSDF